MQVLPYYHPTTIVAVDDSELFSLGVELRLPPVLAFESFSDPQFALDRVNRNPSEPSLLHRCLRQRESSDKTTIEFGDVQNELERTSRFQRVTVIVVDYAMPAMTGVELCSQITDPLVRKILITGVGDQRLAMNALNDSEIDRYLVKGDRRMFPKLISYIRELQRQYFLLERDGIESTSGLNTPGYDLDARFSKYFEVLRRSLNVTEYYSVTRPAGIVMMTPEGTIVRLDLIGEQALVDERVRDNEVIHLRDIRSTIEFAHPLLKRRSIEAIDNTIRIDGDRTWLFRVRAGDNAATQAQHPRRATYSSYLAELDDEHARAEVTSG